VKARSSNGDVRVTIAKLTGTPDVDLGSSNGNIELAVPHDFHAKVSAGTSNGRVKNPLSSEGAGSAMLHTSNGNITVVVSN
jgi:DUF4097 and DUF4098 domain-containing protein YvlB